MLVADQVARLRQRVAAPRGVIALAALILAPVDDESAEGGREMARRIAGSEYLGLTGGHFLLRQEERLQAEIAEFVARHR